MLVLPRHPPCSAGRPVRAAAAAAFPASAAEQKTCARLSPCSATPPGNQTPPSIRTYQYGFRPSVSHSISGFRQGNALPRHPSCSAGRPVRAAAAAAFPASAAEQKTCARLSPCSATPPGNQTPPSIRTYQYGFRPSVSHSISGFRQGNALPVTRPAPPGDR